MQYQRQTIPSMLSYRLSLETSQVRLLVRHVRQRRLRYNIFALKAPSWLQLNGSSRTLYATPGLEDLESVQFDLVGSLGICQHRRDLGYIERTRTRTRKAAVATARASGPTSSPSTISLYPGRHFRFAFDRETFLNTDDSTIYYATSTNNSPLPSWIGFDPTTLSFSGNNPTFPFSVTFNIVASDVPGFSGASVSLQIAVGQHILAFENSAQTLSFTRGQPFSTPHFRDGLTIDGQKPAGSDLARIRVDSPDWLTIDNSTMSLGGTAPDDAENGSIRSLSRTFTRTLRASLSASMSHSFSPRALRVAM